MRVAGTALSVAIAALLVALAVVNRQDVTISLNPLGSAPAASVTVPLFAVVFVALITGVLLGGAAVALGRRSHSATSSAGGYRRRREGSRPGLQGAPVPLAAPPRKPRGRFGLPRR